MVTPAAERAPKTGFRELCRQRHVLLTRFRQKFSSWRPTCSESGPMGQIAVGKTMLERLGLFTMSIQDTGDGDDC